MRWPGDIGTRGRIVALAFVILACTFVLACAVIRQAHEDYRRARHNAAQFEAFVLLLDAAERIAAERGPANEVMASDSVANQALAQKLAKARARTDAALDILEMPVEGRGGDGIVPAGDLADIRGQMTKARRLVDAAAVIGDKATIFAPMQEAVAAMMAAADIADQAVQRKARASIAADEDLTGAVSNGVMVSHLRDQAGRIASYFIPAVASGREIPVASLIESRLARGKALELWRLVDLNTASFLAYPDVGRKRDAFAGEFLKNGLALIDDVIDQGTEARRYTIDVATFSQRYVRSIKPLEELKAALSAATIDEFDAKARQAWYMLTLAWITAATIMALVLASVVLMQVYLLRPLSQASRALLALSEDRFDMPAGTGKQAREMRNLSQAMAMLVQSTKERTALLARLNTEATTDGLTGLLNRATFDLFGQKACASGRASVILLDIDHFKRINDTYGHPVGDEVLVETARRLKSLVRPGDHVGRLGGEEFAVLVDGPLVEALALARRLRLALARTPVAVGEDICIRFTASFGVGHGGADWCDLVSRADSALYRAKNDGRNRVRHSRVDAPGSPQAEGIVA